MNKHRYTAINFAISIVVFVLGWVFIIWMAIRSIIKTPQP